MIDEYRTCGVSRNVENFRGFPTKGEGVEFRPRAEQPTGPGWHYARLHGGSEILPVEVERRPYSGALEAWMATRFFPLEMFDWFGPVRQVMEASA